MGVAVGAGVFVGVSVASMVGGLVGVGVTNRLHAARNAAPRLNDDTLRKTRREKDGFNAIALSPTTGAQHAYKRKILRWL